MSSKLEKVHWRCSHDCIHASFSLIGLDEWPEIDLKLGLNNICPCCILDLKSFLDVACDKLLVVSLHIQSVISVKDPSGISLEFNDAGNIFVKHILRWDWTLSISF